MRVVCEITIDSRLTSFSQFWSRHNSTTCISAS